MRPLNGEKTHTLTQHALGELERIAKAPVPRQTLNPGVANRLLREGLVYEVDLPSPFKTHKGKSIGHVALSQAGRERLNMPAEHGCGHMQGRGAA